MQFPAWEAAEPPVPMCRCSCALQSGIGGIYSKGLPVDPAPASETGGLTASFCPRGSGVEHFLGKEGVTGSNPVVGSMGREKGRSESTDLRSPMRDGERAEILQEA
jgi:hypothetical protein